MTTALSWLFLNLTETLTTQSKQMFVPTHGNPWLPQKQQWLGTEVSECRML